MRNKSSIKSFLDQADFKIYIALLFLCAFGLIMVFSSSAVSCQMDETYNNDAAYLFKRQGVFMIAGFISILFIQRFVTYKFLRKISFLSYLFGIIMIFLLLSPIGVESHNATRWLRIAGVQFQVAEVVKVTLILWLAKVIEDGAKYLNRKRVMLLIWIFGMIPALLIYKVSNDLSSAIVILGITFGMTFIYCSHIKTHIGIAISVAAGAVAFRNFYAQNLPTQTELNSMPFRYGRIAAWIDPARYASNQGYQTLQALYAIGSGGLFGKGLGNGVQKLDKIPEAQNDMIFSIICEELGMVGACILIYLFGYLIYQISRVALTCKDMYSSAVVSGIWLHIAIQVVINISVCVNLIPNTGISLPFISYGGTSVLLLLMEMGLVISAYRRMN